MSAPLLEIATDVWVSLLAHLREQSGGVRESGAFLLGQQNGPARVAALFLPYERLQDDALHDDFVALTAASFSKLWDLCAEHGASVVADVHTHRFGPEQSLSDRTNPMIALPGHIAFILPRFAQGVIHLRDAAMYVYQGSHHWKRCTGRSVERVVRLTEAVR
jgi:proteasome lid subunit RPN8/RPN11